VIELNIKANMSGVQRYVDQLGDKSRSALREAINGTIKWADTDVRREMRVVFDRPTRYTLQSLKLKFASTANLSGWLWFKERARDEDVRWAVAQIEGGQRAVKPMELRLQRAGIMPVGWHVVPGEAMPLDGFGNPSRGEISRILNVLGTFQEAGYNKANAATRDRLRKGNAKSYGFAYWVNKPGQGRVKHLAPGIYRRVYTGFGTSLKPMLIFVNRAKYRARLDFAGIVRRTVDRRFEGEFGKAFESIMRTGSASGVRRAR
jgi:hypothetical protein